MCFLPKSNVLTVQVMLIIHENTIRKSALHGLIHVCYFPPGLCGSLLGALPVRILLFSRVDSHGPRLKNMLYRIGIRLESPTFENGTRDIRSMVHREFVDIW